MSRRVSRMSNSGEGWPSATARSIERRSLVRRAVYRLAAIAAVAAMAFAPVGPALDVALADPVSPLAVTKTANPSPVASGQQITYTITMTNTGGSKITNLVVSDQL